VEPFSAVKGGMAPLDRTNVDTDQIIPKQFLKRIERSGFGPFLFHDWRRDEPDFVLNRPEYQGASVLVAGPNFGCGSSREHAPWSLQDFGFRAVIAPSFGDIFKNNCHKIGLLPVELPLASVQRLLELALEDPTLQIEVDLEHQSVSTTDLTEHFEIDPFVKKCLLNGWDDVALAQLHDDDIRAFEERRPSWMPSLAPASGKS